MFLYRSQGSTEEMGRRGHMVRECTEEETTRQLVDEKGKTQESYVPNKDGDAEDLFRLRISSGIKAALGKFLIIYIIYLCYAIISDYGAKKLLLNLDHGKSTGGKEAAGYQGC